MAEVTHSTLLQRTLSLERAPELQEFVLQNITLVEDVGEGAYGDVTKLDYYGTLVAGKTLHLHAEEVNLREKFVHECRLLKDLRHPHIVQFLGICFLQGSDMPVLVTEFLPHNLHDMVVEHPGIHMSVKLSLLRDITRGLCYLHSQSPPVVHRDLSARNVLLSSALIAKIADFGVARIIDPYQLSRTLTPIPGEGVYMPPEFAQSENAHSYSRPLDMFSFGVLLLFVVTQEFPKDPLPATYTDENEELKPRNELQRRQLYINKAEQMLGDVDHPLLVIMRECLSNVVDRRPTAAAILERINLQILGEVKDDLVEKDKLQMIEELQRLQAEFEELQRILYIEDELGVITEKEKQIDMLVEERRRLNQALTAAERELHAVQASVRVKNQEKLFLEQELSRHQVELQRRETDVIALRLENAQVRNIASVKPPPQPLGLQVNLPLTFAPTHSAPFGTNSAKAVKLGAAAVVVAGGNADVDNQQQVMFYRPDRGWNMLGKYSLSLFAMAVLGEGRLLVLVGGYDLAADTYSNSLVQWDKNGRYWRSVFQPMPTARSNAAAVGYKGYLVVAGGSNGVQNLTTVEVLDTRTVQWSTVTPLPAPIEGLIQSVPMVDPTRPQGDTWYIMGWETGPAHTFSLSLDRFVAQMGGEGGVVNWAQLPTPPPLACCGAVSLRGCLLAVGGKDRHGVKKDIYLYLPGTCEWLRVSELPVAKHSCCCFPLSSEKFLVIGGCDATQFSTRVDVAHAS